MTCMDTSILHCQLDHMFALFQSMCCTSDGAEAAPFIVNDALSKTRPGHMSSYARHDLITWDASPSQVKMKRTLLVGTACLPCATWKALCDAQQCRSSSRCSLEDTATIVEHDSCNERGNDNRCVSEVCTA